MAKSPPSTRMQEFDAFDGVIRAPEMRVKGSSVSPGSFL